ncbi:MAG: hypothetical protein ABUL46_06670, partial [Chitinophaga rupis]
MDFDQLTILVEKYLDGSITPTEELTLRDWYRNNGAQEVIWPADRPGEKHRIGHRMLDRLHEDIHMMEEARTIPLQ